VRQLLLSFFPKESGDLDVPRRIARLPSLFSRDGGVAVSRIAGSVFG